MGLWSGRMLDTVTLRKPTGFDAHGDPRGYDERTVRARVQRHISTYVSSQGERTESAYQIATHERITLDDRIVLTDDEAGIQNREYQMIDVRGADRLGGGGRLWIAVV